MARFVSSFKHFAISVSDGVFLSISRRGYSATAPQGTQVSRLSRPGGMMGKVEQSGAMNMMKEETVGVSSAWGPDPVTGYYRPQNCATEIDAVELREMLLNHKVRVPH